MAEKWDDSANDSPEVVYEGFSPPPTHPQGMINAASSSFVSADANDNGALGGQPGGYMPTGPMVEEQHPIHGEGSHHEEIERTRLCFVCCNPVSDKNFESIKASMNHSHAPLLVLLTDVLGYKLEDGRLHSQVVCKACYHLLDIIDELQQTLTESKTDVRTKFLETVQKLKLKYPRTDKMLKPRCLRCIQMSQTSARKRGRGRGWKSRAEDMNRGRGRGRGRGRARSRSEDGQDPGSDNDSEGHGFCSEEIRNDVLPSKSHLPQTCQDNSKPECSTSLEISGMQSKSSFKSEHCLWIKANENESLDSLSNKHYDPTDMQNDCNLLEESLYSWIDDTSNLDFAGVRGREYTKNNCQDCADMQYYECSLCNQSDSQVFYQYCETCLMCQGAFIPWGNNVSLKFLGDHCFIGKVQAKSYVNEEMICILSYGSMLIDGENKMEKTFEKFSIKKESVSGALSDKLITGAVQTQTDVTLSIPCLENDKLTRYNDFDNKELKKMEHKKIKERNNKEVKSVLSKLNEEPSIVISSDETNRYFVENEACNESTKIETKSEAELHDHRVIPVSKNNSPNTLLMSKSSTNIVELESNAEVAVESSNCILQEINENSEVHRSLIEATETINNDSIVNIKRLDKASELTKSESEIQKCLPEGKLESENCNDIVLDVFVDSSNQHCLGDENRKLSTKGKELMGEEMSGHDASASIETGESSEFDITHNTKEVLMHEVDSSSLWMGKGNGGDHPYVCEICSKKFDSIESIQSHNCQEGSGSEIFTCNLCSYKTRVKVELKEHSTIHINEKQNSCSIQEFSTSSSFTRHMRIHNKEKQIKCSPCGKDIRSNNTLKQHMVIQTASKNFICEVCGSSFSLQHEFTSHLKLHGDMMVEQSSNEVALESVTCVKHDFEGCSDIDHSYIEVTDTLDLDLSIKKQLDEHSDTSHNIVALPDMHILKDKPESEDGKKALSDIFTDISSQPCLGKRRRKPSTKAKELLVEEEANSGVGKRSKDQKIDSSKDSAQQENNATGRLTEKGKGRDCRYICEFCGKKFNSIGGFRYHVDGHEASTAKVFNCNICSYKTRRKADLRKHSVIHTGEKQYKCEVCGQEFSVNSSYTRHMRIHSGEKPYKCTTCGKDFRSGGTLKQHMVKHTGARNFVCEVCGTSFSLRHHYTAHWKLHSGDMPFKCKVCSVAFRNYSALRHHRKKNHPKEEAQRLKDLKMKMIQVDGIKIRQRPKVTEPSVDVLQQAMEAAVDSVTECVDSYTQTLPVNVGTSDSVVSEMIADNITGKDSVVLAITNLQEEVIPKQDAMIASTRYIHETLNDDLHGSHASIVSTVEVGDKALSHMKEDIESTSVNHTIENSIHSSFYSGDGVDSAGDFIVVNSEGQPVQDIKPENVKVVHAGNDDTSPMYIVLSDIQAQDSQLYIVLDKDASVSN